MQESDDQVLQRELAYHEKLYSGFAQSHFAKPAVRALRAHMVDRICRLCGADSNSRVLSLGCGIGDTELLLAPKVREVVGVDLSPKAVHQANADAALGGITNARFVEGSIETIPDTFDVVIAIFFLHHLPDRMLEAAPAQIAKLLKPGGRFYSLDPSRFRLSGVVGRLCIPSLMRKYQTHDERELEPEPTGDLFRRAGFDTRVSHYDFGSSPMAGLFPTWALGYRASRVVDDWILRVPPLRRMGSNFEIVAVRPDTPTI